MLPPLPVPTPAFLQYGAAQPVPKEVKISQPIAAAAVPPASSEVFRARNEAVKGTSSAEIIRQASSSSLVGGKAPPRKEMPLIVSAPTAPPSFLWPSIPWNAVAAGIYLAVAFLLLVRFFMGLAEVKREISI
jgi:hypothetical protein